jgi:hypothetical protein
MASVSFQPVPVEMEVAMVMPLCLDCPLGPVSLWTSPSGQTFTATVLGSPTRYVIVQLDPESADLYYDELEMLRIDMAERAGWVPTENQPKLACLEIDTTDSAQVRYRVRQNYAPDGWHPGMATSGMAMLATAAFTPGTLAHTLLGAPKAPFTLTAATPAGIRSIRVIAEPQPAAHYTLSAFSHIVDLDVGPAGEEKP